MVKLKLFLLTIICGIICKLSLKAQGNRDPFPGESIPENYAEFFIKDFSIRLKQPKRFIKEPLIQPVLKINVTNH